VSQEIFAKYDDLVSVLRDFVDNVEEMYIALEDLRMSGGNTLYIYYHRLQRIFLRLL